MRRRLLLRLARGLVRSSYRGSRVISRLRRGTASVDVRASVFCTVREPVPHPLCGFYAAAFTRLLALFNLARARRSRRLPRHGQTDLRPSNRDGRRRTSRRPPRDAARACGAASARGRRRAASGLRPGPRRRVARPTAILVMPFENVKRDASIFWLGEASSVLLADDLERVAA